MSTAIANQARPATEVTITLADDWEEQLQAIEESLRGLTADQIVEALIQELAITTKSLAKCAILVRMAEEQGVDTRPIANGMVTILRKIAYRQVLPELVVYCSTKAELLQRACQLAIPDQQQLVKSWGLEFAESEGGEDVRMVDPRTATSSQLKQLFDHDRLRPLHEQRRWLKERAQRRKSSRRVRPGVTRASEVSEDEMTISMTIAVTPEWDAAIRQMKKENGWSLKYAATRFLISLGKK